MKEQLVNLETAKLAKEKGFNTYNMYWYNSIGNLVNTLGTEIYYKSNQNEYNLRENIYAPTQSLLQKWLREVHNIHIVLEDSFNTETLQIKYYPVLYPFIKNKDKDNGYDYLGDVWSNTYEEALEIGLQEALKII